nr:MAG TPA: hypothetical protein [Caudoviricetes sp.]
MKICNNYIIWRLSIEFCSDLLYILTSFLLYT